tara:strand:- start:1984 stop:2271 length:288 start_codon:yes stop_codon:yes gene_type:complete
MQRPLSDYVRAAADAAGVPDEMVMSAIRRHDLAHYRQAAMALAHRDGWTMPQVGRAFGGRDHTTVHFAVRKFEEGRIARQVAAVTAELTGQEAFL